MGIETFGDNERALEQDLDRQNGGYGGDYFDENEHRAGQEKRDLATGENYTNDVGTQTSHGMVINQEGQLRNSKDAIIDLIKKDESLTARQKELQDLADALLLAANSDELGSEIEPKKAA